MSAELTEAEKATLDLCPECGHNQGRHSNVGCVNGYDRSPTEPCPCDVQWSAVPIAAVESLLAERVAQAKAEAWDEGAEAVWQQVAVNALSLEFYTDDNPYRPEDEARS